MHDVVSFRIPQSPFIGMQSSLQMYLHMHTILDRVPAVLCYNIVCSLQLCGCDGIASRPEIYTSSYIKWSGFFILSACYSCGTSRACILLFQEDPDYLSCDTEQAVML